MLGRLVDDVGDGEPVVLTKRGRPAAVLLSVDRYERLLKQYQRRQGEQLRDALLETRRLLAHSPEGCSLIEEALDALDQARADKPPR